MKKTTFKITRGLKGFLLAGAIMAASLLMPHAGAHAVEAFVPFGLVAGMKKKGLTLTAEEEKTMKGMEDELNGFFQEYQKGMLTAEEMEQKLAAKETALQEAVKGMVGNAAFDDLKKKFETLDEANRKQAETISALKAAGHASIPNRKTIADGIRDFMEKNKEGMASFRSGQSKSFGVNAKGEAAIILDTKAAITMTEGASTGGSVFVPNVEIMPGLVDLARNKPFLENYANVSTTTSSRIVWTEKYNPQGQAAFIGEGVVKPLISFEIRTNASFAKKVADKIKVSTEMLDDIDFMAAEIENELKYQVDIKVDVELLSGTGDGTQSTADLKGLTGYTSGYVLTSIKTTTPNDQDAIRASVAQIASLNFAPNAVFYNPIDGANMDITKDSQGRPLMMAYKDANGRLWNLQPVETNQIPVGYFLVGDMTKFMIRDYQPFAIYYGWVNDDFEKNLVTIIGERRLHAFVRTNQIGAFVYAAFATVKTAILAP